MKIFIKGNLESDRNKENDNEISKCETCRLLRPIIALVKIIRRKILYAKWDPAKVTIDGKLDYEGGYFGMLLQRTGKERHHIPGNTAIGIAFAFTSQNEDGSKQSGTTGFFSGLEMLKEDHDETANHAGKANAENEEESYQNRQVKFMQKGELMKAVEMDVDDILRIQRKIPGNNPKRYNKGLFKAVYHIYHLLVMTDDELKGQKDLLNGDKDAKLFEKARNNKENIEQGKEILWQLYDRIIFC